MADSEKTIELSMDELRALAGFAVVCANEALPIFEQYAPNDSRPREAIQAAKAFSEGGSRSNQLRSKGLAAYRAAIEIKTNNIGASEAAQSAVQAVGAAFLHPLDSPLQVKHILGSAAYAAHAAELEAGGDRTIADTSCQRAIQRAPVIVGQVLSRYPVAPANGGRVGELMRHLDTVLRAS